ncbi:transcription termination factor 4, mitochondrial [Bombina bombina]|uniref:transcription termination factor 4, mitochondrial n=1 Tax=Bombina bombina TaxID=8345 RepID=UPI00235B0619|nr:transcription termination factor 4, mitochondrial [Bombina bombina]
MVSLFLRHILYLPRPRICMRHLSSLPTATQELLNLGFSEEQTERIFSLKPRGAKPMHKLSCTKELLFMGLDTCSVLQVMEKCPELLKVTSKELRDRTDTLRSLGLREGLLQRAVARYPHLLSLSSYHLLAAAQCLKQRCRFSTKQVSQILCFSPETMTQDLNFLEEAFQYVYFRMGGTHQQMLKCGLFSTSLNELKVRHQFLERLGKFLPPNKKGVTPPSNPTLKEVIVLPEQDFLSHIAQATQKEFETFRKIFAREESEAEDDEASKTDVDSDDDVERSDIDNDSDEDSEDEAYDTDHKLDPNKKRT